MQPEGRGRPDENRPKRVIVASSSPPDRGSGIGAYARELSESLVELGVDVHFLSPPSADTSWLERFGITHVASGQHDDPREAPRAIRDYVVANDIQGAINNDHPYLQAAARALPCPVLAVGHMDRRSVAALACFGHEWIDHIVTISSDMQRVYVQRYRVPLTKCPIVYNGVRDPSHDGNFGQREPGLLRVVFAGGYTHNKGSKLVLDAARAEAHLWQDVRLDWFGDLSAAVLDAVRDLPHVHTHGRVPREEFHGVLRAADVFLLPSRKEGCPMALVEAMSFGVVPITSDGRGAMRWLVTSGREGFVCQLDNFSEQLLACIEYLAHHPDELSAMKRATRERFLSDLQSHQTAECLLDLLARPVVDRSQPPTEIPALRWHRPLRKDGKKAPLLDRLCIRLGVLRRAGRAKLTD